MTKSVLAAISDFVTREKVCSCISLLLLSPMPVEARDAQPNILLIVVDNQPASILGAYGNPDFFGQHGLWGHTDYSFPASLYETAMNIPLIARYPGVIKSGRVSDLMVGQYDLMPTLLDMAGFDLEIANSPGRSFAEHLEGGEFASWGDAVYMDQEATRVIRTHRYSYWKRLEGTGEHELYDIRKDPKQEHDLYGNPDYAEVVSELDGRLTRFFDTHANAQYDLWRGGSVKGSTESTQVYKSLYGEQWKPESEIRPAFTE